MKTFMPRINRVLIGIVRDLSDTRLIRFGVGVYRDESELNNGFAQRQEITRNAVDVQNAIRLLRATGGEDVEEALLIALYKVANAKSTGWRDDSHRLVVLFGDSPGHEPTCFSGRTLRRGVVARKLFSKGIKVVAVSLGAGLDKRTKKRSGCEGEDGRKGQARDITRKTGGTVIAELNSASIRSAIVQTLNFPPRKIHVKTRGCKDVASVSFAERFPVDVASIFPLYGKMTIKMRADMCSRRKSICPITFFDNGAVRSAIRVGCFEPNGCKKG